MVKYHLLFHQKKALMRLKELKTMGLTPVFYQEKTFQTISLIVKLCWKF